MAREYGLEVQFIAPELILKTMVANQKVSRFGIRELDRVIFEQYADFLSKAKDDGATLVKIGVDADGAPTVAPAVNQGSG